MKTYLLTPVIVLASVAFLAVGCCDPNEFKKLQELNRDASAENQRLSNSNTDLQRQVTTLNAQLQQYSGVTEGNQSAFQKLQERNGQLTSEVDALRRKFKELQDGGVVVLEGTMPAEMSSALKGLADANGDLIEFLPKYGMIKFKADLTFELGSDNVQAKAGQALAKLAAIVNSPAAQKFNIYIAGHTDEVGLKKPETIKKFGDNWGLSAFRARAVARSLYTAGVAQSRLAIVGFSKYHPIEANKAGGSPANRRVEIWIVTPDRLLTVPSNVPPPSDEPKSAAPAELESGS